MSKPIIVVFGATGKSGGGMVDYILKDGTFAARGVTRNPNSPSAKALTDKGVEVVKADLDDAASLDKAMQGAYGVFGVTDFWTAFMAEEKQGKDLVDAAKKAGVKHFVWPTLDHSEWHVPHFETKARVNDYLIESGVPRTSLYLAFFAENMKQQFKRKEDGKVYMETIFKTDGKLPTIAASDIGGWALVAFKDPEQWIGKDMKLVNEWITPREVHKWAEDILGEKVVLKEIDDAGWNAVRKPQTEEIWLNIQCFYTAAPDYRDIKLSQKLLPGAKRTEDLMRAWGKSMVQ